MYQGKCIGRLLAFLYNIVGVRNADHLIFHGDYKAFNLNGDELTADNIKGIYRWRTLDGMADVPQFMFFNDYEHWNAESERKIKEAVHDEQVRLGVSELKEI